MVVATNSMAHTDQRMLLEAARLGAIDGLVRGPTTSLGVVHGPNTCQSLSIFALHCAKCRDMPRARREAQADDQQVAMRVVERIRALLQDGTLKAGDKLPPEREFARTLNVSRSSLRSGIGYLAAMGLLQVRHGVGAFISETPTQFGAASLPFLDAIHGYGMSELFEARRVLEGHLAELAAARSNERQLAQMAEELEEMDATVESPQDYLIHDVRFHRIIAQAAGNSILAAIMESLTGALYAERHTHVERTTDLKVTTAFHREIYRGIRSGNARAAYGAMERHLLEAEKPSKTKAKKAAKKAVKRTAAVKVPSKR
jgi:GntR family transcriptional repressor for pyruvate dehydrogenase complex